MHALRRITYAKPIHTHTIHYQINRNFSDPKAIHELSRRHLVNVRNNQLLNKANNPLSASTQSSTSTSTVNNDNDSNSNNRISITEEEEEEDEDEDEYDEECPLSNPYYSRLLDSKLDSCPQQPFNETTNILWGALYQTMNRNNRIETMSRWEQIQRGYIKKDNNTTQSYSYHKSSTSTTRSQWVNTIIDVNDILQPHYSLDDCVRNEKENTVSVTLAKATGSLNKLLDNDKDNDNEELQDSEIIEMRNDVKWKRRKMKLHIKKKRRENLRMKKKTMRERNQQ